MTLSQFIKLVSWDMRVNRGRSWDALRARLLLLEIRSEQFVYGKTSTAPDRIMWKAIWWLVRGFGSIWQWFFCHSNISGSIAIGRGLRLPHPQNIVLANTAEIGEFCTIYHNVSVARNGFQPPVPGSPRIGDRVLLGTGAIIIGNVRIGSDVLIGAGALVVSHVPDHARVTSAPATVAYREPTNRAASAGSTRHLEDPYSIWR